MSNKGLSFATIYSWKTHLHFSWTIHVFPIPHNLVVSFPCILPPSQKRAMLTESRSTTGKQMGKNRNTFPRSWRQNKQEDTQKRQTAGRGKDVQDPPARLQVKSWSPQTSADPLTEEQDTKSIWHPDLNKRNGVTFHVGTCEVLQDFPKVIQDTSTEPPHAAPAAYGTNPETKGLLLHHTISRNCCNKSSAEIQGSRDL